jgi:hypothetical protein
MTEKLNRESIEAERVAATMTTAEQTLAVFSQAEIEQFITDGFVILRQGFSREIAAEGREFVWRKIGGWEDCAAIDYWRIHIRGRFSEPPFDGVMNARLESALGELLGVDRFFMHQEFGEWQVLMPGFRTEENWHVDGHNTHHSLSSREHGLVTLFLFSDVGVGDGGTYLVKGSHATITRALAQATGGIDGRALNKNLPRVRPDDIFEVTGEAGDVVMLHPLLIHGFSSNRGKRIRFACNPHFQLKEPLDWERPAGSDSPLETVIRRALDLPERADRVSLRLIRPDWAA